MVSAEFLEQQRAVGNDLVTPRPDYGFAGLKPGDRWAVCAARWQQAHDADAACGVVLAATNQAALELVDEVALRRFAVDVPHDASTLA